MLFIVTVPFVLHPVQFKLMAVGAVGAVVSLPTVTEYVPVDTFPALSTAFALIVFTPSLNVNVGVPESVVHAPPFKEY
jgi:hypothetical protein